MEDLDILIEQNQMNYAETTALLEALLIQTQDNNIEQILETIIEQNEAFVSVLKGVKGSISEQNNNDIVEAVNGLKPELSTVSSTLVGVGKVLEELAKIRGSKFLGVFETKEDLTEETQTGDYAILKSGELYYV